MTTTIRSDASGTYGAIQHNGVDVVKFDSTGITQGIADGSITPAKLSQKPTFGTSVTASGTSIDFTGIPSWAKRITVMFNGVSTSGTAPISVRIGIGGSPDNSGYLSHSTNISTSGTAGALVSNSGFIVYEILAASTTSGSLVLTLLGGNYWTASGNFYFDSARGGATGGGKGLSGVLDILRVTTNNGTDTFDAGTINIMYEG